MENSKKSICVRNAHNIENIHTYGYAIKSNALTIIFIMNRRNFYSGSIVLVTYIKISNCINIRSLVLIFH